MHCTRKRDERALLGQKHPKVAIQLNNLGSSWLVLGEVRKAIAYFERALALGEETYGQEHPRVAISLINLGSAWKDLGELRKAIAYYERTLAMDEETFDISMWLQTSGT